MISIINRMNIAAINLNLLTVLDVLLTERNVTRAAGRLGLTQPAVSNALAQLRGLLGDALFVRGPTGMVPTDRALALAAPLRTALTTLEAALTPADAFDPLQAQRSFVITTTDYVEFVMLPQLLARLARQAPGIRLVLRSWPHHRVPPSLETGEADLMIGFYDQLPTGHAQQLLFDDQFVCVVRRDHPRVRRRLTLDQYCRMQHVLVSSEQSAPGVVDRVLATRGRKREVALRLSHFLMVPRILVTTDYVAALSSRVAEPFARELPLRILPPPLPLPEGTVGMVWHQRTDRSPAHVWLRGVIAGLGEQLRTKKQRERA